MRFWNTEVFDQKEAVLEKIWLECTERRKITRRQEPLTPDPSPPRGEGGRFAEPLTPDPSPRMGEGGDTR